MRRVAVDHVGGARVDEPVRESPLAGGDVVAPVPAPVDRDDDPIALLPVGLRRPDDPVGRVGTDGREQVHTRRRRRRRPRRWHPCAGHAAGEDQDPTGVGLHHGRRPRLRGVRARTGRPEPPAPERRQCLLQPRPTPVEDVVVAQHADVDGRRGQHRHVPGVHPVVDPLPGPRLPGGRDRRLQVDDPGLGIDLVQHRQRVAPDPVVRHLRRDLAALRLGQLHVPHGALHVRLVQPWVHRVGEHLVDPPAEHDVAGQEQGGGARAAGRSPTGRHGTRHQRCAARRQERPSVHNAPPDSECGAPAPPGSRGTFHATRLQPRDGASRPDQAVSPAPGRLSSRDRFFLS